VVFFYQDPLLYTLFLPILISTPPIQNNILFESPSTFTKIKYPIWKLCWYSGGMVSGWWNLWGNVRGILLLREEGGVDCLAIGIALITPAQIRTMAQREREKRSNRECGLQR
jgi:hypothetical protein